MDDAQRQPTIRRSPSVRRGPQHARGTVYLIILISVMIITVIGLTGLYAAQVQGRTIRDSAETLAARALADASVEVALDMINNDPNWRSTYGGGDWFTDRPFARGSMTVNVRDPGDADVATGSTDPAVIRGTGTIGDARQMVEVTVNAVPASMDSLDAAAAAGRIMAFDGSKVTADAVLTSNDSMWASAASVTADVETSGTIVGSTYDQATTSGAPSRMMPITADVISAYAPSATPITMAEIAAKSAQVIENNSFEFAPTGWIESGCTLTLTTGGSPDGSQHLSVTNRSDKLAGPAQDVTADMINGEEFQLSYWIRSDAAGIKAQPRLDITSGGNTTSFFSSFKNVSGTWTYWTESMTPTWDDADGLDSAVFVVGTFSGNDDLEVDGVELAPVTAQPAMIDTVALSAGVNPYGAGTTNPSGVYSIDCAGADLIIRNCRIYGTLLLIDPGPGSVIEQSVAWAAPAGMPSLIVDGDMTFDLTNSDLDEGNFPANFNPVGFGTGDEDTDSSDSYVSQIQGLIYVSNDLVVMQRTRFNGVVLAGRDITVNGDDVQFVHDANYAASPPPGFDGAVQMYLDRRSWTKVVD